MADEVMIVRLEIEDTAAESLRELQRNLPLLVAQLCEIPDEVWLEAARTPESARIAWRHANAAFKGLNAVLNSKE